MKNLNYTIGTKLNNTMVDGLVLTITKITDKNVSFRFNDNEVRKGGKCINKLVTAVSKISEFENNITEGRLVIQ